MSEPETFRGHQIEIEGERFVYCDTREPVPQNWETRPCGHCGEMATKEGHDACLGTLPGVRNACCGHGKIKDAYVQFDDERWIGGTCAMKFIEENRP
jgi:hypothetical protein